MGYKESLEKSSPYVAIGIFICLIALATLLYQEQKITSEISESCGWGDEDYRCLCEKNDVILIENLIKNNFSGIANVTLVR